METLTPEALGPAARSAPSTRFRAARPCRPLVGLGLVIAVGSLTAGVVRADMIAPGQPFPAWSLADQTGKVVSSADLKGKKYLLWYYPKAMTPGCTAEGRGLRDRYEALQHAGVEVFGVSFDPPAANAAFVAQEQFPFRLLSDTERTLAAAVGAASSTDQPAARRISYLVGPDGIVLRAYDNVQPAEHAQQVLHDVD